MEPGEGGEQRNRRTGDVVMHAYRQAKFSTKADLVRLMRTNSSQLLQACDFARGCRCSCFCCCCCLFVCFYSFIIYLFIWVTCLNRLFFLVVDAGVVHSLCFLFNL